MDRCHGVSVPVDGSFADWLPSCSDCGQPVEWNDAVLMPTSTIGSDEEADGVGIVHVNGCDEAAAKTGKE